MSIEMPGNEQLPNKKTKYFSNFALSHMKEMRILSEGGILGKGSEGWRNISEHCLVEAVGADILAEALSANRGKVVQAALLHDWFKRREIEAMQSVGAGEGYKTTIGEDEKLLAEFGVNDEVINVAHSNIPEKAEEDYLNTRTLEQKIMHYLDAITSGTDFVSVKERFETLRKKQRNVDFSDSFKDKYDGKSLYEVQETVALAEQNEFEKELGLAADSLIQFIKNKVSERIDSVKVA